ncbi:MAG: hypothetical protein ACRDHZ_12765 [Ktedonobacteraceae bacterium]
MQHPQQLPSCTGFANGRTRTEHFNKHPSALDNEIEYERQGIQFMNQAKDTFNQGSHVEGLYTSIKASNGDFVAIFWNTEDNLGLFGTMTSAGVLRTFFGITTAKSFVQLLSV